eukprot:5917976-Prymnesium_polylepis.3
MAPRPFVASQQVISWYNVPTVGACVTTAVVRSEPSGERPVRKMVTSSSSRKATTNSGSLQWRIPWGHVHVWGGDTISGGTSARKCTEPLAINVPSSASNMNDVCVALPLKKACVGQKQHAVCGQAEDSQRLRRGGADERKVELGPWDEGENNWGTGGSSRRICYTRFDRQV